MENFLEIAIPIVVAIITGIVGPLVLYYIKKSDNDKESTNPYDSEAKIKNEVKRKIKEEEISKKVQKQLKEIRDEVDADRAWIIEFHNGSGELDSLDSLKKLSMVYESVSPGISMESENFENLLISFFIETIKELIEDKELLYENIEIVENYEIVRIFEQKGNSSMYMFAMETIDDLLIGILGVDYVRDQKKITEQQKNYLRMQAYSLAGYLENKKN